MLCLEGKKKGCDNALTCRSDIGLCRGWVGGWVVLYYHADTIT
jgi:hypothetical protein